MRRFLLICSIVVLALSIALPVGAFAQTGKIMVVGVPDRFKAANKNESTYGLKTVGIGNRVVLAPKVYSGTATKYNETLLSVTSAAWTLTGPGGTTATIQDTATGLNGTIVYFIPDVAGEYTVGMTATTASGTTPSVSIKVIASKFVGAGISLAANTVPSGCACHFTSPGKFTDWQKTKHAKAVKRRFDALTDLDQPEPAGGHFSNNCMSCHSAGAYKSTVTGAPNDGYTEYATSLSFKVVTPQHPGVFDSLVTAAGSNIGLRTMMGLTSIQCENCHGPASQHTSSGFPTPDNTKLDRSLSSDVCAPCHFSSDRHGKGYAWSGSLHAVSMAEGAQVEYTDRPICAKCHTAQGYIGQTINGEPEPVVASGNKVYPDPEPVGCTTCHDPHSNKNAAQLRAASIAEVCVGCHETRISSRGLHAAHQGPMLDGTKAPAFSLDVLKNYMANPNLITAALGKWSGWELPGYKYENSSHSDIAEKCVTCHMADSPSFLASQAANFSKPDTMLNKLGGHTFRVAYTAPGDSVPVLNPTGCAECHGEGTSIEFVDFTQAKTKALLATLLNALPKRDSVGAVILPSDTIVYQNWKNAPAGSKRKLTVPEKAAAYNYQFVNNDGSFGVHNYLYAKGLLTSSIEQLQLGAAAASIVQIKDVPGDNGKTVQIVWNKFPAESYSVNRLTAYGIWRQDPILPSAGIAYKKAGSFTEMLKSSVVGSQYALGGSVWTFVGDVYPMNFTQYSTVAPTIFDSTKVAGMKYTAFFVCGYTDDPTVVYSSPIDSGYSLNNLTPLAPTGVTVNATPQGVDLKWDAPTTRDNDVVQYLVYRSTSQNFDPTGLTPVLTVDKAVQGRDVNVLPGTMYYYKVVGMDNAGNMGAFSIEVGLKTTNVEDENGIPTVYALGQNYPNPFNPSTQIRFALPTESFVKLSIYSVSGELVTTLVNTTMSAGNHGVTWHGTNNAGQAVSSGVYVYRLQAGDFVSTRKMVLIK
ncbi:MAG: cytochrome c3 family protein [Bacteroidota bacterium]